MASAVFEPSSAAVALTSPAVMRIVRPLIGTSVDAAAKRCQLLGGAVRIERGVERRAIGDRHHAVALDGERARARRERSRVPRIAVAMVVDEERRGEDVAGAGAV